ncbi:MULTISPECIES: YegP family protein [Chryseobacterium]|uniref:YegP family protein n=1 Tax=Chryseobacterium TaxID=59732 RepID=UPI001BEB0921|nr:MULTISPECIES: YegP family protein [Chryseobacterium]MBT2619669.1 YegP family protein [Chryseobacterium sp. ISL-6]
MGKFIISKRTNGDYQFNLKASNGQVILTSQGYSSKSGCENGIESVRVNSKDDSKFERKASSNGKSYFNLKAGNGQIVGTSQMYESESGMEKGIESVKANAPIASVEEETTG